MVDATKKILLSDDAIARAQGRILAAVHALSHKADAQVNWGSNAHFSDPLSTRSTVHLPPFPDTGDAQALHELRGEADLAALALRVHDAKTHRKGRPLNEKAAAIFDALELVRVEHAGARYMAGARHNMQARFEHWCDIQGFDRISERADPPLADILAAMLRKQLTGADIPAPLQNLTQLWAPMIEEKAGRSLAELAKGEADQAAFAKAVYTLLQELGIEEGGRGAPKGDPRPGKGQKDAEGEQESEQEDESESLPMQATQSPAEVSEEEGQEQKIPMPAELDDLPEGEEENEQPEAVPNWEKPEKGGMRSDFYRVYTREFDQIIMAHELASNEELQRLRDQLDHKLMQFHGVTSRLASRLQRLLMARRLRHWEFEQEEGLIDAARLSQVVISPDFPYYYKQERDTDFRDTVVTLLLDNSGSMRGRPITTAALSADILARTLERCGVKVEILGFTTRDWKGGAARKKWVASGSPAHPGRLNDLRHIIYKSADQRWQRGRRNLGLMLKDGILKENIDGEAVLWAHERLIARPEDRKILMVISDGAPVDDSTLSVNNGAYLDAHLREVIAHIEGVSPVELLAIGIGHDVTRYYSRAVTISDVAELGDTMVRELTDLFSDSKMAA